MQRFVSHSVQDTEKIAAKLAEKLKGGEVIAFTGPMGMGKTAFTRGLVLALVNEYDARLTVQHFDTYRVSGWDDLYSTGFFDYLDTDNVLVIEWSENIDGALPENTIYVHMEKGETETERIVTIEGIDL